MITRNGKGRFRHTRLSSQPPTKWEVYEQILKVPYYITFDRYTDNLTPTEPAPAKFEAEREKSQRLEDNLNG